MDRKDTAILSALLEDGRITWSALARLTGLSASACQRRVEAMAARGIIENFTVRLNESALGNDVKAFVAVNVDRKNQAFTRDFRRWIQNHPQVLACHMVSGTIDYMLEVVATDLAAFGRFVDQELLNVPAVKDASSSIVLNRVKISRTTVGRKLRASP